MYSHSYNSDSYSDSYNGYSYSDSYSVSYSVTVVVL